MIQKKNDKNLIKSALKTPESTGSDIAHTVAKAALSVTPFLGGPLVELFNFVIQPPLERRKNEWMNDIGNLIQEIQAEKATLEDLQQSDEFISAVMHASQIALRSHQRSKKDALKNALKNIALGQSPDDALQYFFLNLIDTLSEVHIRILRVFQSPAAPLGMSIGGLSDVLENAIPELRNRRQVYDQFWRDLYLRGLLNTESLHITMSGPSLQEKRTTGLGDAFLNLISEPTPH